MKIFGIEISLAKKREDAIAVSAIKPAGHVPISRIPTVKVAPLLYAQQFARINRGVFFLPPEYDLAEIGKIEDVDGYVAWSFRKKVGLMFKEGVHVRGGNKRTQQYYKTRMAQIAQASGIPTTLLMKRVARSLIRTSNAYLVKVRSARASGGQVRRTADGKTLQPVAAYFPAAPEMFKMDLDPESGKIRHWRQQLPNGWYKLFKPEDVIHFTFDKREGFSYGVPSLVPVVDDIRALRQIEENIELLIYQHLFPLFHYKVGTETAPAGYTEDGFREIDLVQEQVKLMPAEGMIVTPERHEITAIGTEGRAMNAEGYMTYFKKRVFAGLGMSSIDFGEAETSNRSTSNTLSRALVDNVKAYQDDFEAQWDQHVIRELLLESTFGEDVLEEENMVHLQFAEIDIDTKIKHEAHAMEMFKSHGLTWDEYRSELGLEPILVPDDPDDMDHTKWPEWFNTYWKLFEEPTHLIKAVDEPYISSQAAIHNRSIGVTQEQGQAAQKAEIAVAKATQPPRPASTAKKDSVLTEAFDDLEMDTAVRLQKSYESRSKVDYEYLGALGMSWTRDISSKLLTTAMSSFIQGYNDQTGGMAAQADLTMGEARTILHDRINRRLQRLVEDVVKLTNHRIDKKAAAALDDMLEQLHISFSSVRYRTDFIWDVELRKAYNYGRLLGMRDYDVFAIQLMAYEDSCEQCKAAHGRTLLVKGADIDDIPPFHANSRMFYNVLTPADAQNMGIVPEREPGKPAVEPYDPAHKEISAVCPKCGTTALKDPKSGMFWCLKCHEGFQKIKDDLNVGGAGTVMSRQPKVPPLQQPWKAFAPSKRNCPRCGYSVKGKKSGKFKCSRCSYVFTSEERPAKISGGKPQSYMPPKKRKEQAELPAGFGGHSEKSDAIVNNEISRIIELLNADQELTDDAKLESCILQVKEQQRKKNPGMSEEEVKSHAFAICNAQLKKKG